MYALVTGASSGLGKDMATLLAQKGYDLIIVARSEVKLNKLKEELNNVNVVVIKKDLSIEDECYSLIEEVKDYDIEVLINNAGFGLFGDYANSDIKVEMNMIDTNIKAPLILMKHFLNVFKKKNKGYILNVASAAAFTYGPLMSVYYSTKHFLYSQTLAVYGELRKEKSNVYVGALCPGPVATSFSDRANVKFGIKPKTSEFVSKYAIKKMFKKKLIIIPGFILKLGKFATRFVSDKMLVKIGYHIQNKKES